MIKNLVLIFIFFISVKSFASHHAGPDTSGKDFQGDLRLIYKNKKWTHLLELSYAKREVEDNYQHALLGSRLRVASNWKTGIFIQQDYGVWHDEDWGKGWNDTSSRGETSAIVEVDYKTLLGFKTTTIFSFRTRYLKNFYNQNDTIKIRPSLSFFPSSSWSYFIRYEAYLPLNYGSETIYEHWGYLATSYKLNDHLRIGPYVSYAMKAWRWTTGGQDHKSLTIGLSTNIYF